MVSLSVLCDENIDREVIVQLEERGHRGEHVVDVLGAGADDNADIAPHAKETDQLVLTKDTDFLAMDESQHAGVLFIQDHRLLAYEVASIIDEVASYYTRDQLRGKTHVTESWL